MYGKGPKIKNSRPSEKMTRPVYVAEKISGGINDPFLFQEPEKELVTNGKSGGGKKRGKNHTGLSRGPSEEKPGR